LGGVLHDIIRHNQGRPHLAIIQKAENVIERHLHALVGRREQLVRRAAYRKELFNDWLKEIERFITIRHNQGRPHLAIIQEAENAIERHLHALVGRREQLVRQAAYGKELFNDWFKEIERFITKHIKAFLTSKRASEDAWYYEDKGQIGPLTLEELKATLSTFPNAKAGYLFVRCGSFANWKQAKDIPELNTKGLD
jgi:hypothetical protein